MTLDLAAIARHELRHAVNRVIIETTFGGREFRDYWSLSGDGRTLTMAHLDDDLTGHTTILNRRDP